MTTQGNPQPPRVDVRKYRGQTVALDPNTYEVVAFGTLPEAAEQARKLGVERPILWSVRQSDA